MAMYRAAELDSFSWQGPIIDRDLSAPPGSPVKGDRYIVKATGTGDWAGHDNAITYYTGAAWVFIAPVEGLVCWVKDEDLFVRHNGTIWDVLVPAGSGMGYVLQVFAMQLVSPVDGATYFVGGAVLAVQTASGVARVYIPKAGSVKCAYIMMYSLTAGTSESISCYIRKNNSEDTLVGTLSQASNYRVFLNASLNIAFGVGDYLEVKFVCPTWSTNPQNVTFSGSIYIE